MLLQISSPEMEETSKIDEAVESLSEMSKIFDQPISLTDYLDRLVESESTLINVKQNVKRFVYDFENRVKKFTENEKILTCKTREIFNFLKKGKMVISVKIQNFSRSRMTKRTSPLESSREI